MFETSLPSGQKVIFRAPSFADRRNVMRQYDRNEGYMPEDLLAAKCLTHVGGEVVAEDWAVTDPVAIFDGWDLKDQAFYLEVFMNMFSLDEKAKATAQEQAKKLMGGSAPQSLEKSGKASKLSI